MQCLFLHGLAGTPFEVLPAATALEEAGFSTVTPLLPGHGDTEAAYCASTFDEWRAFARAEYLRASEQGPLLLAGYSLGGILALDMAIAAARGELPPPAGVVAVATPLFLHRLHPFFCVDKRFFMLPLTSRLQPFVRMPPRGTASREIAPWQGHETVCSLRHFKQIDRVLPNIRSGLGLLRAPLCVMQLHSDASCPPFNALHLARQCARASVQMHLLRVESPHGGHLPLTHKESRKQAAAIIVNFARQVSMAL